LLLVKRTSTLQSSSRKNEAVIPAQAGIQLWLLPLLVIPAQAGIQSFRYLRRSNVKDWIPACAGMTSQSKGATSKAGSQLSLG
jgi:hypothetical protein